MFVVRIPPSGVSLEPDVCVQPCGCVANLLTSLFSRLIQAHALASMLAVCHLPPRCSVMIRIFMWDMAYNTRASCFNFSTSFAAISCGVPVMNSVFFDFCGT